MSVEPSFGVNGRFLTHPITGVQRYARNVLAAMDHELAGKNATAPIISPRRAKNPLLPAMPLIECGPFDGHLWEQVTLPVKWRDRLLNLCNSAPAIRADQVVCIHDANVFVAPESYSTSFRATYAMLHRSLANHVARIATVSDYSARQIARYLPVDAGDIAVLPNGHEHAFAWNPAIAQIAPALFIEHPDMAGRPFVIALGSRARHKNLQLLFDIAPRLDANGIDIILAGGGADIYAAENLPSFPNVKVLGYVTDHDLAFLMEKALCLAFPSWTEGFGLPIVEAMARACPVISSDRASMPEVCGNAALLAAPDDPVAWISQIAKLRQSQDLRAELIARGRERIKMFSWTTTAAGYLELMREPKSRLASRTIDDTVMPSVAIAIATLGRPKVVTATLKHLLATQSLAPSAIIVSCASAADAGEAACLPGVKIVTGPPGLPAQRNAALMAIPQGTDVVAFFDDDFVADAGWLAAAARAFRDDPDIVGFTGDILADGIKGPGLTFEEAVRIVEVSDRRPHWTRIDPFSPYGCNMAFRLSAIGALRFDERLVMYGWLEDRDFGGALAKKGGRLIKCANARGVHMGIKSGRVAGDRLGYSQVVNPVYLLQKRTMTFGQVVRHVSKNIIINVARSLRPEPFIDRRGRLRGNLLGLADILKGRLEPERAATITPAKAR